MYRELNLRSSERLKNRQTIEITRSKFEFVSSRFNTKMLEQDILEIESAILDAA